MGTFDAREMPDGIDTEVVCDGFFEVFVGGSEDIKDSGGDIGRFKDSHELNCGERVFFAGDCDYGVAHCDERSGDGDQAQQGLALGSEAGAGSDGFVAGVDESTEGGLVDLAVVFVGNGGVVEEKADGILKFLFADSGVEELDFGGLEIFGDVIENLTFEERGGFLPCGLC